MDLSKLNLPNSITHFTLVGDNATNIEHIEHYHQAGESNTPAKRLSEEDEDALAVKIEDCFKEAEGKSRYDWALQFVRHVSGTTNTRITDTVRDWSAETKRRIDSNMKSWSCLGKPLFDAGLYTSKNEKSAESNWNQRVNK